MHHATQDNVWFGNNIVMCVRGELVIATKMSWHHFEDSKRATETAHPNQQFCLVSGQMTLEMHHLTQENIWLVVNIVLWVHCEFSVASQMSWNQFEVTKQSLKAHQKWSFCLVSG